MDGCGIVKLSGLTSDDKIVESFQKNKSVINSIIKECKSLKETELGSSKENTGESFNSCKIALKVLKEANVQGVEQGYAKSLSNSNFFQGSPILFKVDEVETLGVDVFIEEKGYVFSETPIKNDLLEQVSLDRLANTELFEKRSIREEWRFKQIEPTWYLYYRQYYAAFLS